jgi:hypothetical protein
VDSLGRLLTVLGIALVLIGAFLTWGPRVPWLGRLPGDLTFGGPGGKVYIPLGTSLLISIVLSVLLSLWARRH